MSNPAEIMTSDESDEGIADMTQAAMTTSSLTSGDLDYPVEHGRRYHAYKSGSYHRPNDEDEQERLDLMNELFLVVDDHKLHQAPIGPTPHRILDIGTGTGLWCINMGDEYPSAEITGIDISGDMPVYVPANVKFEIDDVEDEWTYRTPFDYIHSRYMAGSIKDWPGLMKKCFQHTRNGGWVEFQDFDIDYYSQDGSVNKEVALRQWLDMSYEAEKVTGRSLKPGPRLENWMKDAGFVNVQVIKTALPLGPWPKDRRLKRIGLLNWTQLWLGIQGMSLRLFIDCLGWSQDQIEHLLLLVKQDLQNPRIHPMFDLYTVWGQKPDQ